MQHTESWIHHIRETRRCTGAELEQRLARQLVHWWACVTVDVLVCVKVRLLACALAWPWALLVPSWVPMKR